MVCRVKVDAPAGVVELEGEAQFVTDFFDKFLPLIQAAGFGTGVSTNAGEISELVSETGAEATEPQKPKAKKRKRANPPAGASCRDRMTTLRQDGFFKEPKTPTEIVAGLAKKGWVHNVNQVGAALTNMFSKSEIQRTKDGGSFTYFWDRD